jgi:hypothetical protein
MEERGEEPLQLQSFSAAAVDRIQWSASGPGYFHPREKGHIFHLIGDCMEIIAGLKPLRNRKRYFPCRERGYSAWMLTNRPTGLYRLLHCLKEWGFLTAVVRAHRKCKLSVGCDGALFKLVILCLSCCKCVVITVRQFRILKSSCAVTWLTRSCELRTHEKAFYLLLLYTKFFWMKLYNSESLEWISRV